MHVQPHKDGYLIHLDAPEACLLLHCCRTLLAAYQQPDTIPLQLREPSLTNGGFENWKDDNAMLHDTHQEARSQREIFCTNYLAEYSHHLGHSHTLRVTHDTKELLLGMLNERRMFLGYTHDINAKDMDRIRNYNPTKGKRPDERTQAILEVAFLGHLQAELIHGAPLEDPSQAE